MNEPEIREYNRDAWDRQVSRGNQWTVPVTADQVTRARSGDWQIVLTPTVPVPRDWFGDLSAARVLCLAGGGGQQGPILAAAGAQVTVFDNSPQQLQQDRMVAERDGLELGTVEGDMRNLTAFADGEFDLIVHPCSNCFVPDILPVWREAARVLRKGGELIAGFCNPIYYVFDYEAMEAGRLEVRHRIPYSDLTSITPEELAKFAADDEPLCFGHSLQDQIGGQLAAGLVLTGFYEDDWTDDSAAATIARYLPAFAATRSRKE